MAPTGNVCKMKVGDRDRERGKEHGKKNADIFHPVPIPKESMAVYP